jgi:hypothetical protein
MNCVLQDEVVVQAALATIYEDEVIHPEYRLQNIPATG